MYIVLKRRSPDLEVLNLRKDMSGITVVGTQNGDDIAAKTHGPTILPDDFLANIPKHHVRVSSLLRGSSDRAVRISSTLGKVFDEIYPFTPHPLDALIVIHPCFNWNYIPKF